jgi:hypothetical protein
MLPLRVADRDEAWALATTPELRRAVWEMRRNPTMGERPPTPDEELRAYVDRVLLQAARTK